MWANAQRDGRCAEYRWCPLFNMCGSMVSQSPTAELRQGKKEEDRRNHREKI